MNEICCFARVKTFMCERQMLICHTHTLYLILNTQALRFMHSYLSTFAYPSIVESVFFSGMFSKFVFWWIYTSTESENEIIFFAVGWLKSVHYQLKYVNKYTYIAQTLNLYHVSMLLQTLRRPKKLFVYRYTQKYSKTLRLMDGISF